MPFTLETRALDTVAPDIRDCLADYLEHLDNTLAANLVEVRMLSGSASQDNTSGEQRATRATLELVVVTDTFLRDDLQRMLFEDSRTFFLRCSQQVSPSFWTLPSYRNPSSDRAAAFVERLERDGTLLGATDA